MLASSTSSKLLQVDALPRQQCVPTVLWNMLIVKLVRSCMSCGRNCLISISSPLQTSPSQPKPLRTCFSHMAALERWCGYDSDEFLLFIFAVMVSAFTAVACGAAMALPWQRPGCDLGGVEACHITPAEVYGRGLGACDITYIWVQGGWGHVTD